MAREMTVPMEIDALGRVAFTEDPYQQVEQHLEMLLGTPLRTRVMRPDYGVDTLGFVFSINDEATFQRLAQEVIDAAASWEPSLEVRDVVLNPAEEDDQLSITVYFSLVGADLTGDTSLNTATIQIGGTVVSAHG